MLKSKTHTHQRKDAFTLRETWELKMREIQILYTYEDLFSLSIIVHIILNINSLFSSLAYADDLV